MESYTPGKPAVISFALVSDDGELLVPSGLRFRILDENETVLQAWGAVELPEHTGSDAVTVTVAGVLNILTPPATRGARVVELEIETSVGTITKSESFLLQGPTAITFGVNSFLTYPAATVAAADFVPLQLPGWHANERAVREQALIEAHGRILRLPVRVLRDAEQSIDGEFMALYGPTRLSDLTATQVAQIEPRLLAGLKLAQLVEANEILADDPIKAARRDGIVSMTVGETSQFFGVARPFDAGVSTRALKYLERWLRFGAALGRR